MRKLLILLFTLNLFMPFVYSEETTKTTNTKEVEKTTDNIAINQKYTILIEDDEDLLTSEEEEKLRKDMIPLTEYGNIVFKTTKLSSGAEAYARNYYYGLYGSTSGSVFLIDMGTRQICIASQGYNSRIITNSKSDIIMDNIYRYASNKQYYECAKKAFSQMYTLLSGGKILEPMRYISNAILSIVIAFFIGFLKIMGSSKTKNASENEVLKNCDVMFQVLDTNVLKTGQHREYSPQSSGSGGFGGSSGGGGGGGGGGGSSGSHGF